MNSKELSNGILRALAIALGIAILLYFIFKIQSVIVYIAISVVISLTGRPIVRFLRDRLKFNNLVAVAVTMVILLGFIAGLVGLFIPLLVEQGQNLSLLNIDSLQGSIQNLYNQAASHFNMNDLHVQETLKESGLFSTINFALIPELLNAIFSGLGSFSIGLFSVLFISFFFLKDSKLFENSLLALIPDNKINRVKKSIDKIKNLLSRYFVGLVFQITVLFVIYTTGLLIVGVQNAVVIAFLCALINLIPYLGPVIGGLIMILLTMTSNLDASFSDVILPETLYVLIVISVGQLIDNFFSQPIIFSRSVKSHPLEIFLVIIIAGLLFGIVGMVVAIPAYTAIKVILKEFLSDNKIVQSLTKNI
ncbi:AI-2E family transporter [Bizionia argentinensis JUB59]|uniref:AI-2E family transporter n=1 Tax=Bizionia argentinensis JUB59 TaxID=1046627 RepID=G2E938_9FLAO|nr:AI-2E family transporter [Bizionia argentinensis]EGV44754.1 AI-2E family transporter [Bizionia argentinensis JUB59]